MKFAWDVSSAYDTRAEVSALVDAAAREESKDAQGKVFDWFASLGLASGGHQGRGYLASAGLTIIAPEW